MKTLQFKDGTCETVQIGRFVAKRYSGTFELTSLQAKADCGLWYATAMGFPVCYGLEGEAGTPEESVQDLKDRAADLRDKLHQVFGV